MNNEWRTFFDYQAGDYHQEPYVQHTIQEADFLVKELQLAVGDRVLDVGCGVGRHAIELARRGYRVAGFDLSLEMLRRAQQAAPNESTDPTFFQADAAAVGVAPVHDAAICLCEGGFGLLASSSDPLSQPSQILAGINRGLKPGAPLLLTAPNGLAKIRAATAEQIATGEFDPIHLVERFDLEVRTNSGPKSLRMHEKGFTPSELILLARAAGFEVLHLWSGTAGGWQRRPPELDEMEIMLVARKKPGK